MLDIASDPPAAFLALRPALTDRKSSYASASFPPGSTAAPLATPEVSSMPLLPHRGASSAFVPRMFLRNPNALQRQDRKPTTVALTQVEALIDRQSKQLVRDPTLLVSSPLLNFRHNESCACNQFALQLMHNILAVIVGVIVGGMYFQVKTTIGGELFHHHVVRYQARKSARLNIPCRRVSISSRRTLLHGLPYRVRLALGFVKLCPRKATVRARASPRLLPPERLARDRARPRHSAAPHRPINRLERHRLVSTTARLCSRK